jgi:hypothetical protein
MLAVAVMALTMAVAGTASAAVNVDANGVGTVDKGDVMQKFGMNESKFQAAVKTPDAFKFTVKYQMDSTDVWSCSDGSTESRTSRVLQSRALNVTNVFNTSANKVTGFTLDGINENVGGSYLSGTRFGAPYVGYCSAGGFAGFLPHVFENTVLPGVSVSNNGTPFELPNTPVEVAPVA